MNIWEATKALEEGKKIHYVKWAPVITSTMTKSEKISLVRSERDVVSRYPFT